jgi:hypothetical protein
VAGPLRFWGENLAAHGLATPVRHKHEERDQGRLAGIVSHLFELVTETQTIQEEGLSAIL